MRSITQTLCLLLLLACLGCGGGNSPVNEGKDMPVPPKKDKNK